MSKVIVIGATDEDADWIMSREKRTKEVDLIRAAAQRGKDKPPKDEPADKAKEAKSDAQA